MKMKTKMSPSLKHFSQPLIGLYRTIYQLQDARFGQIATLMLALSLGLSLFEFSIHPIQIGLTFISALLVQYFFLQHYQLNHGYLSAMVSGCGISLLIRADNFWVHPLLAALAIGSKFMLRYEHRHIFNPANFAACLAIFIIPHAWLSAGQWGQNKALMVLFFILGSWVCYHAKRLSTAYFCLLITALYVFGRAWYLGQAWSVPLHQLQNGSLWLFSFFMITDPLTTPQHRWARLGYVFLVVSAAMMWQWTQFKPHGHIIALFLLSPVCAYIQHQSRQPSFKWRVTSLPPASRV